MNYIDKILTRRSVKAASLTLPAPCEAELRSILTAAMRVPDHGKLAPWRFHVFDKAAQTEFGELVARRFAELNPDATEAQLAFERERPQRAPLMIAITLEPVLGRIPLWEQELSAGAACMNLLHAAHALGYSGNWLTEWIAYDQAIIAALCASDEGKIAGFIYLGTAKATPEERERPEFEKVVTNWTLVPK